MPVGTRIAEGVRDSVRSVLERMAWFGVHHPRSVLIVTAIATGLSLWAASDLQLTTDIESLIPRDVPSAERLHDLLERYGSADPIVLAISGRGRRDVDDRIDLALAIRDQLEQSETLHTMTGLLGEDPWALLEGPQADAFLLYLEPDEVERVVRGLDEESIDARVEANRERLRSPIGPLASRLLAEDPLGLLGFVLDRLEAMRGQLAISSREGTLVTEDEDYVLLLVRAEGRTNDFRVAEKRLDEITRLALAAMEEVGIDGTAGVGLPPDDAEVGAVHVGITGASAILVDYRRILSSDIRDISVGAFVAVMTLFLFAFRRGTAVIVAGVPLVVGLTWALGFAAVTIGEISVFTAGSVAILCGLAIDFTIHLYNRYLEEVHAGRDMAKAFAAAHGETGLGIVAAAATTAWAFLAAGFSTFRGLRDLGLLCATGMLLALLASFLLVPALCSIIARLRPHADRPRGLASFGLGPLLRAVVARPGIVVALGIVATIVLGAPAMQVRLDEDFSRFRPTSAPSIQLQQQLVERVGTSLRPVIALVPGDDAAEVMERSARVERAARELVEGEAPQLATVLGPASVVPPPSAQQRVLRVLREARNEGLDPAEVEADLLAALERHGFRVDARARAAAARLRGMLARDEILTMREAREGPLGDVLGDLVIADGDGGLEGLVSAYPTSGARSRVLIPRLREVLGTTGVPHELVGARVLGQDLHPILKKDAAIAVSLAAVGVLLILGLVFRRPSLVVLTFVPLSVGVIVSVGLMAGLGVDFNLVSLSIMPMILGIGIDNGIHVVHRYIQHRTEGLSDVFRHTGRGIVMTSLTTMVGFGALVFADYPGLRSSGLLAILGVGATLVTAVTLVPAFLTLIHVRDTRRR